MPQTTPDRGEQRVTLPEAAATRSGVRIDSALAILFFVSGWSAILYELVWQRTLFAVVGINIEAVTLIVTEFMVGLGLGSLVGGQLSRVVRRSSIYWFAGIELAIAAFGIFSLPALRTVGDWTIKMPPAVTPVLTFLILAVPTVAMGATLPLLVNWRVARSGNVGWSVGSLYFVNTLGAAVAAYAAVVLLMGALGQQGVVWVAAASNVIVACSALLLLEGERSHR